MTNPRLASRYAQSLVDIAQEQNVLDDVLKDVTFIRNTISGSRELELFLSSPIIKADKKSAAVSQIFGDKINPLTVKFIQLLINKGREAALYDIAGSFENIYDEKHKVKKIKVTTAVAMTEEIKNTVMEKAKSIVPGYTMKMEEVIDEDIIGGFIIEVDDKLYDASIRTELNKIRKQFLSNEFVVNI